MKHLIKLIGILVLAGILVSSCSKMGSVYDGTSWWGRSGSISLTLTFSNDAQKCMVSVNPGEDILSAEFNVVWTSQDSFTLLINESERAFYSGVISKDMMSLDDLRFEVKQTYELKKIKVEDQLRGLLLDK